MAAPDYGATYAVNQNVAAAAGAVSSDAETLAENQPPLQQKIPPPQQPHASFLPSAPGPQPIQSVGQLAPAPGPQPIQSVGQLAPAHGPQPIQYVGQLAPAHGPLHGQPFVGQAYAHMHAPLAEQHFLAATRPGQTFVAPAPATLPGQLSQAMPPPYYNYYASENSGPFQQPQQYSAGDNSQAQSAKSPKRSRAGYKLKFIAGHSFCTSWKGALEITVRVSVIVVAIMSIGVSAAIINIIDSNSYFDLLLAIEDSTDEIASIQSLIRASRSVSAFMIFLAVMSILIEIPTIIGRFTLRGGKTILRIFHVLDAVASGVLALLFLCGAAPSASYSSQWSEPPFVCTDDFLELLKSSTSISFSCEDEILTALLAVLAVIGFVGLVLTVFLGVWIIIAVVSKGGMASNILEDSEQNNVEN